MSPLRRLLPIGVAIGALLAIWVGYIGVRDLSVFEVQNVTVKGLASRDSPAIARALRDTAGRMTTLHVKEDELRDSVDAFPNVLSVSASAHFPNGLEIRVVERVPVALVQGGGRRVPVASDGTLLPRPEKGVSLPLIEATTSLPPAGELRDRPALALVTLLAGAPEELRPLLAHAKRTKRGFEVALRDGPTLSFGDLTRLAAKWAAAARVLADPSSRGARSLDLRLPHRPAASGFQAASAEPAAGAAEGVPAQSPAIPQP